MPELPSVPPPRVQQEIERITALPEDLGDAGFGNPLSVAVERPGYWEESKSLAYGFLLALPLAVFVEVVVVTQHLPALRTVGNLFLSLLQILGSTGSRVLLGLAVVGIALYLVYHFRTTRTWPRPHYLLLMVLEGFLWAFVLHALYALSSGHARFFVGHDTSILKGSDFPLFGIHPDAANFPLVGTALGIGAGVYEELAFRVLLFNGVRAVAESMRVETNPTVVAVLISATVFTLAHLTVSTDPTYLVGIFIGGVLLSTLYATRGFGVTAVAHASNDIILTFGFIGIG